MRVTEQGLLVQLPSKGRLEVGREVMGELVQRLSSRGLYAGLLQPERLELEDAGSIVAVYGDESASAFRFRRMEKNKSSPACSASRLSLLPYCRLLALFGAPEVSAPLARLPTARTMELTLCLSLDQSRLAIASKTLDLAVGGSRKAEGGTAEEEVAPETKTGDKVGEVAFVGGDSTSLALLPAPPVPVPAREDAAELLRRRFGESTMFQCSGGQAVFSVPAPDAWLAGSTGVRPPAGVPPAAADAPSGSVRAASASSWC